MIEKVSVIKFSCTSNHFQMVSITSIIAEMSVPKHYNLWNRGTANLYPNCRKLHEHNIIQVKRDLILPCQGDEIT